MQACKPTHSMWENDTDTDSDAETGRLEFCLSVSPVHKHIISSAEFLRITRRCGRETVSIFPQANASSEPLANQNELGFSLGGACRAGMGGGSRTRMANWEKHFICQTCTVSTMGSNKSLVVENTSTKSNVWICKRLQYVGRCGGGWQTSKVEFRTLCLWARSFQQSSCLCGLYEPILFVRSVQEGSALSAVHQAVCMCVCVCQMERVQVSSGKWLTHLCRQVAHSHYCLHTIWRSLPVCLLNYTVEESHGKGRRQRHIWFSSSAASLQTDGG